MVPFNGSGSTATASPMWIPSGSTSATCSPAERVQRRPRCPGPGYTATRAPPMWRRRRCAASRQRPGRPFLLEEGDGHKLVMLGGGEGGDPRAMVAAASMSSFSRGARRWYPSIPRSWGRWRCRNHRGWRGTLGRLTHQVDLARRGVEVPDHPVGPPLVVYRDRGGCGR